MNDLKAVGRVVECRVPTLQLDLKADVMRGTEDALSDRGPPFIDPASHVKSPLSQDATRD